MNDSEDRKLPDDPEIEPEMYMFFNRLLHPESEKKEEPEPESVTDSDDLPQLPLSEIQNRLSVISGMLCSYNSRYQKDKADTDSRISELTKLVSEMVVMMKTYTGMMKAYVGASA